MPELLLDRSFLERLFNAPSPAGYAEPTLFQPTPTFPQQNQQVPKPPPINDPGVNAAFANATYTGADGSTKWQPIGGFDQDFEIYDDLTGPPRIPDPVPPGFGAIARESVPGAFAGGVITGVGVGAATGSVAQGIGAGLGSTAGEIAGAYVGGALGSLAGPAGTVAGAFIGQAVGGAIGAALGQQLGALIDPNTIGVNDIPYKDLETPYKGGQCVTTYLATATGPNPAGPTTRQAGIDGPLGATSVLPSGGTAFDGSPGYSFGVINRNNIRIILGPSNLRQQDVAGWSISNLSRFDGQPDNCGDPAPSKEVDKVQPADPTAMPQRRPREGFPPVKSPYKNPFPDPVRDPTGSPVGRPRDIPDGFEPYPIPSPTGTEPYPYPNPTPPPIGPSYPFPNPTGRPSGGGGDDGDGGDINVDFSNDDCPCSTPVMRELEKLKDLIEDIGLIPPGGGNFEGAALQSIDCEGGEAVSTDSLEGALEHLSSQIRHIKNDSCDIAKRVGVVDFPAEVPVNFANPDAGVEELNSLAELTVWVAKQLDGLIGQFPSKLKTVGPDGDEVEMTLPNVAETLSEMMGLLIDVLIHSSENLNTSSRALHQAGSATQQAHLAYLYARANADFLGYEGKEASEEIPLAYSPGKQPFDGYLKESKIKVKGWEFTDDEDLKSHLAPLLQAAGIIRAVHFRQLNPNGSFKDQIQDILKTADRFMGEDAANSEDWKAYLRDVEQGFSRFTNDPSPYGRNPTEGPQIRDISPDGQES